MKGLVETKFDPQEDISAHELALILRHLVMSMKSNIYFGPEVWDEMDNTLKRHFLRFK